MWSIGRHGGTEASTAPRDGTLSGGGPSVGAPPVSSGSVAASGGNAPHRRSVVRQHPKSPAGRAAGPTAMDGPAEEEMAGAGAGAKVEEDGLPEGRVACPTERRARAPGKGDAGAGAGALSSDTAVVGSVGCGMASQLREGAGKAAPMSEGALPDSGDTVGGDKGDCVTAGSVSPITTAVERVPCWR